MQSLQALFPSNDFSLLAVIVALPLIGALVNGIFGKRAGKEAVTLMALVAVGGAFILSVAAFFLLSNAQHGDEAARFVWKGWHWISVGRANDSGSIPLEVAFSIDALSGTMALVVTGVGFLIHLYSTKYMADDPGYHRYFAYLNLFIFSMLVLILGDNLPILFVGWEGVGLCSYLLIGFWFHEDKNASAGKKAFITNRIGDFGLLVAMALLVYYVGALDWTGIEGGSSNLLTSVQVWPVGTHVPLASALPEGAAAWLNQPRHVSAATLVGLALFLGCAGKSAQIPLYVWLPDAMAGPTPVSALIHAATMVTAGVYLVCRMAGVFVLSPAAMFTVAFIGALTAVFAATIALVQNDIKKVLAYSTVSQLGYMFLGVGVGAFVAGFFHVITHAFFKACLFLAAGSVIHAMHARIHDTDASQDMRNMGGIRRFMPYTYAAFVASWAAIVGFPLTAGFFSKDEILFKAYTSSVALPTATGTVGFGPKQIELFSWPTWAPQVLYGLGVAGAIMTAFYMTRLVVGIFFGEFRGWNIVKGYEPAAHGAHHAVAHPLEPSELEEDSDAAHDADDHGHHEEFIPGEPIDGPKPHESPWQMTAPLIILGALALVAGFLNAHLLHITPFEHWLEPVFESASANVAVNGDAPSLVVPLLIPGILAFLTGVGVAYWMYIMKGGEPAAQLAAKAPGLYRLVYDKWRIDELYEETIIGAVDSLAELAVWFDKWVVDGIVARLTALLVAAVGTLLRYTQTGRVQAYAAVMVAGMGAIGWYVVSPHADATVVADRKTGSYRLTAAPGLGYQYRWDVDGDGKWDGEQFSGRAMVDVPLEVDESRTVRLEVRNAFKRASVEEIELHRPKLDLSGAMGTTRIDVQRGPDGQLRRVPPGQPPNDPRDAANAVLKALQGQRQQPPGQPAPQPQGQQPQRPPGRLQPVRPPPGAQPPAAQPPQQGGHQ